MCKFVLKDYGWPQMHPNITASVLHLFIRGHKTVFVYLYIYWHEFCPNVSPCSALLSGLQYQHNDVFLHCICCDVHQLHRHHGRSQHVGYKTRQPQTPLFICILFLVSNLIVLTFCNIDNTWIMDECHKHVIWLVSPSQVSWRTPVSQYLKGPSWQCHTPSLSICFSSCFLVPPATGAVYATQATCTFTQCFVLPLIYLYFFLLSCLGLSLSGCC